MSSRWGSKTNKRPKDDRQHNFEWTSVKLAFIFRGSQLMLVSAVRNRLAAKTNKTKTKKNNKKKQPELVRPREHTAAHLRGGSDGLTCAALGRWHCRRPCPRPGLRRDPRTRLPRGSERTEPRSPRRQLAGVPSLKVKM